jgi:hypothetical protein
MPECTKCGHRNLGRGLFCDKCQAPLEVAHKQCGHCGGGGQCARVVVKGFFRKSRRSCESCAKAAGQAARSKSPAQCAVCIGTGWLAGE